MTLGRTGKLIIETQRLWIREFVLDDAEAMFAIGKDPLVQKYTGDPCLTSVEDAEDILRKYPIADYLRYGFGRWAVVLKATAQVIGMAGLKFLPECGDVDLGFRLLPSCWGLGFATEASLASVNYGWETLRLNRIIGLVEPANIRSIRVLEKSGLKFETMIEFRSKPVAQYAISANGRVMGSLNHDIGELPCTSAPKKIVEHISEQTG